MDMKPRLRDGYTRIHNELIDRVFMRVNFSSYEWRVLWSIIRMSWGWNRPGCYTSYRELAESTGIDIRHVARTIKKLEKKLIIAARPGKKKTHLQLNTDYMTWRIPEKETLFTSGTSTPSEPSEVTNNAELVGVADSGDSRGNGMLPTQATPGVAHTGNADSLQPLAGGYFADRLKKVLKTSSKETEG